MKISMGKFIGVDNNPDFKLDIISLVCSVVRNLEKSRDVYRNVFYYWKWLFIIIRIRVRFINF